MTKIPSFGFSAFLRVNCMNERPQKCEIRKRFQPTKKKGYDFHRRFRKGLQKLADGSESSKNIFLEFSQIDELPERNSALQGLKNFNEWRILNSGEITFCDPLTFFSPNGLYKVFFEPDFVIELPGRKTAVHLWNTTKTELNDDVVQSALAMVAKYWPIDKNRPDDFALLSLPNNKFYRWSDAPYQYNQLGLSLLLNLEKLCIIAASHFSNDNNVENPKASHPGKPKI